MSSFVSQFIIERIRDCTALYVVVSVVDRAGGYHRPLSMSAASSWWVVRLLKLLLHSPPVAAPNVFIMADDSR